MFNKTQFRSRLSYSNVVASLALFVALGGTATAAITLPRDSVGAPQIRADGVRSPEIQGDAVRSPEIAPDAVRSSEIQGDAVRSSEIAPDAVRSSEIEANAVKSSEIELDAVKSSEIEANAVKSSEIELDAVKSSEIEADAVKSSEIAPDAVKSSEIEQDAVHTSDIEAGAVHSSDILDQTIVLNDLAPSVVTALDTRSDVRLNSSGLVQLGQCTNLPDCQDITSVSLPAGRWLVWARFSINGDFDSGAFCGLLRNDDVFGFASNVGTGFAGTGADQVSFSNLVTNLDGDDSVAIRCQEAAGQSLAVPTSDIIALKLD